jgi:hypothetical protein
MKHSMLQSASTLAIILVGAAAGSAFAQDGVPQDGVPQDGVPQDGVSQDGVSQDNVMWIPDQRVIASQTDVAFPVMAKHDGPMQGFQIRATFDPELMTLQECTHQFSPVNGLLPEIFQCSVLDSVLEAGVLFDFVPPFTNKILPPSDDDALLHLIFDIADTAPTGKTEIGLSNDDPSVLQNIFVIGTRSVIPELESSCVDIVDDATPADFFIRGDVDDNGQIELSDAIVILDYLFLGGAAPRCPDAADVNDEGAVQVTSAIALLEFLFLGGSLPNVPFPTAGLDPSPDGLEPCSG